MTTLWRPGLLRKHGAGLCLGVGLLLRAAGTLHGDDRATLRNFLLRSWDSEDGLPVASIRGIVRSADGYLWIGTDAGLVRFDGVRFVTLTTNDAPVLGEISITALMEDSK